MRGISVEQTGPTQATSFNNESQRLPTTPATSRSPTFLKSWHNSDTQPAYAPLEHIYEGRWLPKRSTFQAPPT